MFAIEMLPANHGDCLLIEYGMSSDVHRVLIDGGPPYAKDVIRGRLEQAGGHVDLLVISHVDFDHVGGIVSLLARLPAEMRIDEVWFNGWDQLPGAPQDIMGAVQGEMVSAAIQHAKLPWNDCFGAESVALPPDGEPGTLDIEGGLRLTLLAPARAALARLRPKWRAEVEAEHMTPGKFEDGLAKLRERERLPDELGEEAPDPEALHRKAFVEDTSLANWSSVALLAEYDGRSCLLAADAPAGSLLPSVDALCARRGTRKLEVDAVKLAHHGSKGSTSVDLIDRLESPRYLVSTNGKIFGHPSPEALARVIMHGGDGVQLCFNYRAPHGDSFDSARLRRRFGYETAFPAEGTDGLRVEL